jgi:2-amino-1-hydroxyethylphosphonate dioxygenase (glycine-forming)
MNPQKAQQIVDEIFSLYEQYGADDYIGEPVSQIEHMCQAAQLAQVDGHDNEVVLAAFFHDIGHLCEHIMSVGQMDGYGVVDHEILAANYLRQKGFSGKIVRLVESHVKAKRYLTYKYPEYYNELSEASKMTLEKQGGIMNNSEAKLFEQDHLHPLFIKLRQWDDKAKLQHQPLPSLNSYKEMAFNHLLAQN